MFVSQMNSFIKKVWAWPLEIVPDSEYGWEKLFSERLFLAFNRNYKLDVRIARFHNIFGPYGSFDGGREKAPAALCRKLIIAKNVGKKSIDVWGDGEQTRSFMFIDDCIKGTKKIFESDCREVFKYRLRRASIH